MSAQPIPGGLLVVVEGIDGAGKTTLAQTMADQLRSAGVCVSMGKEPTQGQWGRKLRESASAGRMTPADELHYLLADRREHVANVIAPALARGEVVILDRYFPSMVAYQGAAGLAVDELLLANDFAPRPDVLLLLDLTPEQGLARIRARGDQPNAFETTETLTRCRQIFLELEVAGRTVLDASEGPESVAAKAMLAVLRAVGDKAIAKHGPSVAAMQMVDEYLPSLAGA